MSKEKKNQGKPAKIEKKGNKTIFKCGKKHSTGIVEEKKDDVKGVGNES